MKRNDKQLSRKTQKLIYQESNSKCTICSESRVDVLEIHHIKPRSEGGGNESANLILVCSNCHKSIGSGEISTEEVLKRKIQIVSNMFGANGGSIDAPSGTSVALCTMKGGVGRSILSILIALEASRRGAKTLLLDADYRDHASSAISETYRKSKYYFYGDESRMFHQEEPALHEFVFDSMEGNLDVLPLGSYVKNFAFTAQRERLQNTAKLRTLLDQYDFTIADTHSHRDQATEDAIRIVDFVLIPTFPHKMEYRGASLALRFLKEQNLEAAVLSPLLTQTQLLGIFLTNVSFSPKFERLQLQEIRKDWPEKLFSTYISKHKNFSASVDFDGVAAPMDPHSQTAIEVTRLVDEIFSRMKISL